MQMSELMISSPHNFPCIDSNVYIIFLLLLLKHVKACHQIKIYQSKYYSEFIQSGYEASFTFA